MWDMTYTHDKLIRMSISINISIHTHTYTYKYTRFVHVYHGSNTIQQSHTACNTLHHTATHCGTLQHTAAHCYTLLHTATLCSTLQHTAVHCSTLLQTTTRGVCIATHCNTLQHVVYVYQGNAGEWHESKHAQSHHNTLQDTATNCNKLQYTAAQSNTL